MEEELFGRTDIDNTLTQPNAADPMHPARLSEPMRWLVENPGTRKMECMGFGLNLVSGNFEFACLIVIDSEDFWHRFGGQVEASWESSALRQYSSLDGDSLAALSFDDGWSNERLFAFPQALQRLRELGGDRVNIPAIEWGCAVERQLAQRECRRRRPSPARMDTRPLHRPGSRHSVKQGCRS